MNYVHFLKRGLIGREGGKWEGRKDLNKGGKKGEREIRWLSG